MAFFGAEHYTFDKRFETGYFSNNRPKYEKGYDINRMIWQKKIKTSKINNILATSNGWKNKLRIVIYLKKKLNIYPSFRSTIVAPYSKY